MIHPLELWELAVLPPVVELTVAGPSVHQRPPLLWLPDAGFQPLNEQTQTLAQLVSGHHLLP